MGYLMTPPVLGVIASLVPDPVRGRVQLRIGFLRGQYGVDLIDGDVAALLGAVDQLLDRQRRESRAAEGTYPESQTPLACSFQGAP
jgi:hypothetical protein